MQPSLLAILVRMQKPTGGTTQPLKGCKLLECVSIVTGITPTY